jgi:hypothetical protein
MAEEAATGNQPAEKEIPAPLASTGVAEPAAETAKPADKSGESTAETAEKTAGEPAKTAWPDDWREKLAGGDDKLKNLLARYTAPDAFAKAFKELRATYDARDKTKDPAPELPENPTDEQLAAWRKAKNIPEKPEDYEFEVPDGKELSDADYDIMMDFAKSMHGKNMPSDVVKNISSWFLEYQDVVAQRNADAAFEARAQTEETLRAEWGADYKPNINLMANVLQEHLGSGMGEFLAKPFADGSRLGDNASFIKLMAEVARKIGGSTAELYTTDVHTTGKSLEARKAELMKMMNDPDPLIRKKYWADDTQAEMARIQTALVRRTG